MLMSLGDRIRNSQLFKSIFRHPAPVDRRTRVLVVLSNFVLHLHPTSIKTHALRPSFTWCMGGITFFLFLVETVTGVLLMFYYRPTVQWAYHDMLNLRDVVSLGILRELHRWGAHALVIAVMLHMYRVFLTGSYKPPREFNWGIGVLLLLLTLLLSFTGYLLPWDQLAIWAVTVGSNMVRAVPFFGHQGPGQQILTIGGIDMITSGSDTGFALLGARTVSEETLNRFYVLHCVAIPLLAAFLMAVHFWRIRKDGGISGPL
jgi:quinol-cytochrome oxidoreductase complex cytochrome b subunit